MRLIANQQTCGDYGVVQAGAEFDCDPQVAQQLIEKGIARNAGPPRVLYETKVVRPEFSEVKPDLAQPFRDLPDPHPESPALAALRDAVRTVSDLPEEGDSGGQQRGGRKGSRH